MMRKYLSTTIGAIAGGIMVLILWFGYYYQGQSISGNIQNIANMIFALAIVLSLWLYNKKQTTIPPFKNYFQEGFKTFIIATLIMVLFTYLFYKINTELVNNFVEQNMVELRKTGEKTEKEILENAAGLRKYYATMMVSGTIFKYLILGALVSLVGSVYFAIIQKK